MHTQNQTGSITLNREYIVKKSRYLNFVEVYQKIKDLSKNLNEQK